MGDEFYCVIKLISGEEIFSLVSKDDNDGDPVLVLQTPIIIKIVNSPQGSFVKIKPWMEIINDDFFIVKPDKIITMTEVKEEETIKFYNRYLNDDDVDFEDDGRTKISDKMGYISTVDDARDMLENLYKLKDNKES